MTIMETATVTQGTACNDREQENRFSWTPAFVTLTEQNHKGDPYDFNKFYPG